MVGVVNIYCNVGSWVCNITVVVCSILVEYMAWLGLIGLHQNHDKSVVERHPCVVSLVCYLLQPSNLTNLLIAHLWPACFDSKKNQIRWGLPFRFLARTSEHDNLMSI